MIIEVKNILSASFKKCGEIKRINIFCQLALLCFLLTGCSYEVLHYSDKNNASYSSNNARVASVPSSGYHRVQGGDTLFSIAFRYGLDYRELARFNRIDAPYVIYPNQKIKLSGAKTVVAKTSNSTAKTTTSTPTEVKKTPPKTATTSTPKTVVKEPITDTKDDKPVGDWSWPVDGAVVRGFSNAGVSSKGIDIKAEEGALVKAAASGTVVYAGSGLIGYGNLVIVKHNDIYLSAYAYNERILVKEKQNVKAGDSLAVIGGKGEDRPLLHFEVRRDGQPIDPVSVLPRK
ncbi:peptidoglycan DD-metalloendopeptidase family protein [Marinomonas sp. 2405UD66-6]|uniref:peptidoglycan DD-metalloendopeptidase family protein n=1 Tax=Marinomonas sp. 2405UD66-6 TaxID=3391834 RepID=UPI0039C8F673